jgi:two-component system chemotaxis response regulator CheY
MTTPKVLSVGQCGADHAAISRFLRQQFGAMVVAVDSADAAIDELRGADFDIILVNRVFDLGGSGLELIAAIKNDAALAATPVILVSDRPDAQRRAEALGAAPGFGKSALGQPETVERIKSVLPDRKQDDR